MRRITLPRAAGFFFLLLLFCLVLVYTQWPLKVDRLLYDSWVRLDQSSVPDDVVIVGIDADSIRDIGRWPWPRAQLAQLMEKLATHDIRAAAIDVYLTEKAPVPEDDKRLAAAIASLPLTVLPVVIDSSTDQFAREYVPVNDITRVVSMMGHVELPIDDDGIVRRVFLKAGVKHAHWSTLSLALLEVLESAPEQLPGYALNPKARSDVWVEDYEAWIPFYGESGTFTRISAGQILRDEVPVGALTDRIVFVGVTTKGLQDVVPTAVSILNSPMPGVEIHANIFASLRSGLMVERVNPYISIPVCFVLLFFMLFVYSRYSPEWGLLNAAAASLIPIIVSYALYHYARLWFAPLASSLPVLVSYLLWSRHRLLFVIRFLERERSNFDVGEVRRQVNEDEALVDFFESACRHLPVKAWRFSHNKSIYAGGEQLPDRRVAGGDDAWALRGDIYARRYPGKQALHIEFQIDDAAEGVEIAELIDSLSRIRSREKTIFFSDSIERLQSNALVLSSQLDWLRSVKAFSDSMLAGSPAGFAVWNAAGECIRANELVYQFVPEFTQNGELREFIYCIEQSEDADSRSQYMRKLLNDREKWQVTYRRGEQESIVNFRTVGERLSTRLVCASIVDVSDIRTSERARAEMVDYLSHDLRSPLISALCLLEKDDDPRIEQNINNSLAMMDNLLHVARADSLSDTQFQPLLLNAVLDNSLDQLLPQALSSNISFDVDTIDEDLWINGDAASLERAIINIMGNAIKYSPEDTTVTVRLDRQNTMAVLTVDDQGAGIAPDMLDKLFTRFRRDKSTAGEFKGIGLGLALVSRVVNLHSGNVAASNIDNGTRITLELPLEAKAIDLAAG
ncbi:MAG: CHASE2 domain-containing protein [Granulosicoccus sp.]|nr:CHASE2 domain-containing protein [Granulosicoccus sp.]